MHFTLHTVQCILGVPGHWGASLMGTERGWHLENSRESKPRRCTEQQGDMLKIMGKEKVNKDRESVRGVSVGGGSWRGGEC